MDSLIPIFGAISAFLIIVGVHEFGHFWVARRAGVHIEKFSIGFGKPIFSWYDRHGTEYCLAILPFGGYVKMHGESLEPEDGLEGDADKQGFMQTSPVWRMAIAFAGPAINFIFAIAVYWALLQMGYPQMSSTVGKVVDGMPAANAGLAVGDRITAVDGVPVGDWQEMSFRLVTRAGDGGFIDVDVETPRGQQKEVAIAIDQWLRAESKRSPNALLGFYPIAPRDDYKHTVLIGEVKEGSAAEEAGLQSGDVVTHINAIKLSGWSQWVEVLQGSAGTRLALTVVRQEQPLELFITPKAHTLDDGRVVGLAGVYNGYELRFPEDWPAEAIVYIDYGPVEALQKAWVKVEERIWLTLVAMKKMFTGDIALNNLSGPITIAQVAGRSASYGLEQFLQFLAFFSLSLGVLNLLPIPVLDGGHIVMHGYEAVTKKPMPLWVQSIMMRIGLAFILTLAALAIYFDTVRVLSD